MPSRYQLRVEIPYYDWDIQPMQNSSVQMTTRERIKLLLRRIIADILFYSGICFLYRLLLKRNQAVILMYHRVIDSLDLEDSHIQSGMYVTREVFSRHMEYLSRRYHVMSLDELVEIMENNKPFPMNACVLTFDDGWKDFYTHAFPILTQYHLPAAVFLVSSYVGSNGWFWPERVSYLLMKHLQGAPSQKYSPDQFPTLARIGFFPLAFDQVLTSIQKIEEAIERIKDLPQVEIAEALKELQNLFEEPCKPEIQRPLLLNWHEVGLMAESLITFGSHTRNHIILTTASERESIEEIIESQKEIEEHITDDCWSFCYPNGNYNDSIREIVGKYYRCALTGKVGSVKQGDDIFSLKRVGIHNDISCTRSMFACKISLILK